LRARETARILKESSGNGWVAVPGTGQYMILPFFRNDMREDLPHPLAADVNLGATVVVFCSVAAFGIEFID
jgi:hypothetical protein